jgi:hypothetical protein
MGGSFGGERDFIRPLVTSLTVPIVHSTLDADQIRAIDRTTAP